MKTAKRSEPFRVQADERGFDKLTISDWFHLERLSRNQFCLILGERVIHIEIKRNGQPCINWDVPEQP